jgi:phospholipid/cholesterol/gamma-HCH transport system substrate-binding protein
MFSATSAQKTKLGLFLLGAGGLFVAIFLVFIGLSWMEQSDRYYVRTGESVSGLRTGAPVEVRGVAVGRVADIDLDGLRADPVILALDVDGGTPIPADAHAVLKMKGVTGMEYVDIEGGSFTGPLRKPGDMIPTAPSALSRIKEKGDALLDQSRELIDSGTRVTDRLADVLDDENRARVDRMLERGERAMGHLEEAAAQVQRTGAKLEQLVGGDGARLIVEAGGLVGDARRVLQANRNQIAGTISDLREAARSFRRMAQNLERDPSRIIFRRGGGEGERR